MKLSMSGVFRQIFCRPDMRESSLPSFSEVLSALADS